MINDFDLLLKQCKTRTLKRIIRIVLRVLGSIALLVLGVYGYYQWGLSMQQPLIVKPVPKTIMPMPKEENISSAPIPVPVIVKTAITPASTPLTVPRTVLPAPTTTSTVIATQSSPALKSRLLEVSNASATMMSPEQMYQRSPKFETALGIARDFYAKEDYAQAAIWAKKANQMNREAEEAWLLYAKSYYAQGKKSEAVGVLELFLNYKDSKTASDLIKAWR